MTVPFGGPSAATFRPVGGAVLVRPRPAEERRASGLVLTHRATDESIGRVFYGTAVAVGPGDRTDRGAPIAPVCAVGDEVICAMGFGDEVQFAEGPHWLVTRGLKKHGHGVLGVLERGHVHCWHMAPDLGPAICDAAGCPSRRASLGTFEPLPSCSEKGARLLESKRGVVLQEIKPDPAGPDMAKYQAEDVYRAAWAARRSS